MTTVTLLNRDPSQGDVVRKSLAIRELEIRRFMVFAYVTAGGFRAG
jgi:hypothetical protein